MRYSLEQLAGLWRQAGGPSRYAATMGAIALAESGGNPRATHTDADGSIDRGLWQINSVHGYPAAESFDPATNAREALQVFHSQGLTAWSTYVSGAYRRFMATSRSRPRWGVLSHGNYAGTDQGVDFTGSGPIPALDKGKVTAVRTVSIEEGGSYPLVAYQLQAGPYKGRYVYVMENFQPQVQRGQQLEQGDPIGEAAGRYPYIEYGFASGPDGSPAAPLYPNPHAPKAEGETMWSYMQGLIAGGPTLGPSIPGVPAVAVPPGGLPTPRDHGPAMAAGDGNTLVDTWSSGFGGGLFGFLGDVTGVGDIVDFLKAALWLVNPMNWLRVFEALVGAVFMFLSLIGLGVILASRSTVVQESAGLAQQAPGPLGAAGRTVTTASSLRGPQARRRVVSERIPQRVAERAATQQGEREERQAQRRARVAAARASGRRRAQAARTRDSADRFGQVPF